MNVQRKNLKNEIKKEDAIANIETPKDNFTVKVVEALAKRKSGSESVEMTGDIQEMTSEKERSLIEFAGTLDFAPQMKAQEKEVTENVIGADETERVLVADSLETDLSQNLKDEDVSPIAEEAPRSLSADNNSDDQNLIAQTAEESEQRKLNCVTVECQNEAKKVCHLENHDRVFTTCNTNGNTNLRKQDKYKEYSCKLVITGNDTTCTNNDKPLTNCTCATYLNGVKI